VPVGAVSNIARRWPSRERERDIYGRMDNEDKGQQGRPRMSEKNSTINTHVYVHQTYIAAGDRCQGKNETRKKKQNTGQNHVHYS
jgi:hypothetical protein